MKPNEPATATTDPPLCICASCGRPPGPSVLVLTLVFAEEQLLLMKRGVPPYRGCWAPPGGFVENAESLEQAAAREIEEEVGIRLASADLIPNGIVSLPALNQIYVTFIAVLDQTARLRPRPPEALDARWFRESEYPREHMWEPAREINVARLFAAVRSRRFDFYQQTGDALRVLSFEIQQAGSAAAQGRSRSVSSVREE